MFLCCVVGSDANTLNGKYPKRGLHYCHVNGCSVFTIKKIPAAYIYEL
jgi:hypothetical protein